MLSKMGKMKWWRKFYCHSRERENHDFDKDLMGGWREMALKKDSDEENEVMKKVLLSS